MELLQMVTGDDWLMRPILRGLCSFESVITPGGVDIYGLWLMNEAITVEEENQRRIADSMRKKSGG